MKRTREWRQNRLRTNSYHWMDEIPKTNLFKCLWMRVFPSEFARKSGRIQVHCRRRFINEVHSKRLTFSVRFSFSIWCMCSGADSLGRFQNGYSTKGKGFSVFKYEKKRKRNFFLKFSKAKNERKENEEKLSNFFISIIVLRRIYRCPIWAKKNPKKKRK